MSGRLPGEKVTVYVPCDVVMVRTRLGFQETVTPMEQIVLRAVHAGADTLGQLVKVLGLSRRLALDLVQDLWRSGYLTLIRSYAGLRVARDVAEMIEKSRLHEMASAEMVIEDRMVMLDKLSGHILPFQGSLAPAQRRLAVPVENSAWQVADAGPEALLEALERGLALEQETRTDQRTGGRGGSGRPQRVLGAFVEEGGTAQLGRRWLALEVRAAVDPDTDQLTITAEDETLPVRYRQEAGRQLTSLVAERPDDEFSRALRAQALPSLLSAPTLESAVARLLQQTLASEDVPGRRGDRHRKLSRLYREVQGMAQYRVAREVEAEVVAGDRHPELLAALIDGAREQVVLVNPWLRHRGLERIEAGLRRRIERGVQVCVLWGIKYREQDKDDEQRRGERLLYRIGLATGAHTLSPSLDEEPIDETGTESSFPTQDAPLTDSTAHGGDSKNRRAWLLTTKQSARTHAKVALLDDRAALVTSWNFLNSPNANRELGVLIRAQPGSDTPLPMQDLLRWTRSTSPRYDMSRLVKVESFGALERLNTAEEPLTPGTPPFSSPPRRHPRSLVADLPEPPDPPAGEGLDDAASAAAKVWADAWAETARAAERWLLARDRPAASLVVDGNHRDVLWTATREARTRLVITSDRLSGEVVGPRLLRALTSALDRGVEVHIFYGRPDESDAVEADPDSLTDTAHLDVERRLGELAGQFPGRLTVARSGTHAKVVLWDDQAAVGSFNFLSHEGTFTRSAHRQRGEVSILLKGRGFCDDLARALGLQVSAAPRPAPSALVVHALPEAQALLNAVAAGADPADTIERHFEAAADPWALLQRLAESASQVLVRCAAAWCLSRGPEKASPEVRDRWLHWLIEDLWADHAFLEAAVLRDALGSPHTRPRAHIAELAAARGTASYSDALLNAWMAPPSSDGDAGRGSLRDVESAERRAVVAAAMEHVLFDGDETALEILVEERARLNDTGQVDNRNVQQAWLTLVDAAVQFARESSGRQLPLDAIRVQLATEGGYRESARLWAQLRAEINQAANTHLANTHSQRTLAELFRTADGPLARLGTIADREDLHGLDAWIHQVPRVEPGWGRLIDDAGQRVDPGRPPMHSTHRRKVIHDLMTIGRDARRLAGLARPAASAFDNPDDVALLAAARRFTEACVLQLPVIREDDWSSAPELEPVKDILARFSELEAWRRVEEEARGVEP